MPECESRSLLDRRANQPEKMIFFAYFGEIGISLRKKVLIELALFRTDFGEILCRKSDFLGISRNQILKRNFEKFVSSCIF